jgi:hypothetical protein
MTSRRATRSTSSLQLRPPGLDSARPRIPCGQRPVWPPCAHTRLHSALPRVLDSPLLRSRLTNQTLQISKKKRKPNPPHRWLRPRGPRASGPGGVSFFFIYARHPRRVAVLLNRRPPLSVIASPSVPLLPPSSSPRISGQGDATLTPPPSFGNHFLLLLLLLLSCSSSSFVLLLLLCFYSYYFPPCLTTRLWGSILGGEGNGERARGSSRPATFPSWLIKARFPGGLMLMELVLKGDAYELCFSFGRGSCARCFPSRGMFVSSRPRGRIMEFLPSPTTYENC